MKTTVSAVILVLCATGSYADINRDAAEKVQFELYTRESPLEPEILTVAELPAPLSLFNPIRPTKILVHGWHGANSRTRELKEAFLDTQDVNVFILNWHAVDTLIYPLAVARVKTISRQLATLVEYLVDNHGLRPADLHIIGHSLGAHISGLSANHLRSDITIARITGLDPAGPLFKGGRENRLDKSHAAFVDIIHTCGNVFGYKQAIGHVDFYPNGGACFQPGCTIKDLTTGKCSHNRAYYLFRESILLNDTLQAYPAQWNEGDDFPDCENMDTDAEMVPMGLPTLSSARGLYCLATRGTAPFGYGREVATPFAHKPSIMQSTIMKRIFMWTSL